uniref:Uncharacterized protein n=1 Tax=Cacopsylla melanoneura TaxID=428564 RepID=A0A8D9BU09_9HEMI
MFSLQNEEIRLEYIIQFMRIFIDESHDCHNVQSVVCCIIICTLLCILCAYLLFEICIIIIMSVYHNFIPHMLFEFLVRSLEFCQFWQCPISSVQYFMVSIIFVLTMRGIV